MNAVSQNPLINRARDCMVRPTDQKRVRNDAPMFVRQLDLIEIKDDDDVLEAIKRKFQADENRQKWIRDELVCADDLDDLQFMIGRWILTGKNCRVNMKRLIKKTGWLTK